MGNDSPSKHATKCPNCTKSPSSLLIQFDQAIQTITDKRGETYDHPSINFHRIAGMKSFVQDCKDPEIRHVLEMLLVKISRIVTTPNHFDSWVDIVGYARTAVMVLDRRITDGEDNLAKNSTNDSFPFELLKGTAIENQINQLNKNWKPE